MGGSRTRTLVVGLAAIALLLGLGYAFRDQVAQFAAALKDLRPLIRRGGYPVLSAIVFAETGLLIGFFLPGDSLLVVAGILSMPAAWGGEGILDITTLHLLLIPAAIVGDAVNYAIGRRTGPKIFSRPDGVFFRRSHLERAQRFYERYGGKTIVLARFLPIVRTFAPFAAGMAGMAYRRFLAFNVLGAVLWVSSMTLTGYLLARSFPDIERHLHVVMAIVIVVSFIPGIVEVVRERRRLRREAAGAPQAPPPSPVEPPR